VRNRETRFIAFNLGAARIDATEDILRRAGLEDSSGFHRDGILAGYFSIELPVADPRLATLIRELDASNVAYADRAGRQHSERDLDRFPWLVLRTKTVGLLGGVNLGQAYDHAGACPICGSGSVPIAPLLAQTARMGRKAIDSTAHDGHLIVTATLADAIEAEGLTGFAIEPVSRSVDRDPDPAYRWLRIVPERNPLSPASVLEIDDPCLACGRAGHYDTYSRSTEFWCEGWDDPGADFSWTWEYFGRWRMNAQDGREHVGGFRLPVVSQRVRSLFKKLRVRQVSFEPIFTLDARGLVPW
jgi:hypothetical protein